MRLFKWARNYLIQVEYCHKTHNTNGIHDRHPRPFSQNEIAKFAFIEYRKLNK